MARARGFIIVANDELKMDLHINYWRCTKDRNTIVIDFGMMVQNANIFQWMKIFLPFRHVSIMDLGSAMYRSRMVDVIFNEKLCTIYVGEESHFYRVQSMAQQSKEFGIYEIHKSSLTMEEICEGVVVEIKPKSGELSAIQAIGQCYFRFRVKTEFNYAGETFTKSKTTASFLYSEIEESEKISIRINNSRDVPEQLSEYFEREKNTTKMCDVQWVRLFVIASFRNRIETAPSYGQYTTRKLENELWEAYLGDEIDLRGEWICHYWKMNSPDQNKHYSFLCELREKRSNWRIIIVYIITLLLLDMVSNWLWEFCIF